MFNAACRLARKSGFGRHLDADRMIAAAKRKTGLSDFGDEWFIEPLRVLVEAINEEARLHPLGTMVQNTRMVSALCTRLRAEQLLSEKPHLRDTEVGKIVLIAGLQRTGTTVLHRLIGADPKVRALRSWETLNPLPVPGEGMADTHIRKKQAKRAEKALRFMAPEFFAIHPIEHDAPEEDILLLDLSFMSQTPEATMQVPTYAKWLEKQDHTKSYQFMHTMLQLLHMQRPGDHWILKTPHHMEHLDVIANVFPDVFVVQTHRDPKKSIASFCSMVAHSRGILSDQVDPGEIAEHWIRKSLRMMKRSMEVRKSSKNLRFIDISYYDLIKDPIGEVRKIHEWADIAMGEDTEKAIEDMHRGNAKDRFGRHVYQSKSFGLDEAELDRRCEFYRQAYGIPHE